MEEVSMVVSGWEEVPADSVWEDGIGVIMVMEEEAEGADGIGNKGKKLFLHYL